MASLEADSQNQILATYKEIAEGSGVGIATVTRLMRALRKADVVTESRRSLWRLNPKVIFKGNHEQRLNVLIRFRSESQRDLFDDPPPTKTIRLIASCPTTTWWSHTKAM